MSGFSDFVFEAGLVARSIGDYFSGGALRLGVTGLSRAGKTVFITALVNNLIAGARLPVLAASAEGRIAGAARAAARRRGAALRLRGASGEPLGPGAALAAIDPAHLPTAAHDRIRARRRLGRAGARASSSTSSTIPANGCSTCRCSTRAMPNGRARRWPRARRRPARRSRPMARGSRRPRPASRAGEDAARRIAELFTAYLKRARDDVYALSTLPPGRFLMPGDLEGSPALTFAPLAARRRGGDRAGLAGGDDGAPLRGL